MFSTPDELASHYEIVDNFHDLIFFLFWFPDFSLVQSRHNDLILTFSLVSIGVRTLEIPLLKVIVGNANLLEVKAEGSFDDTDSYVMKISAASKALRQVRFSLITRKSINYGKRRI